MANFKTLIVVERTLQIIFSFVWQSCFIFTQKIMQQNYRKWFRTLSDMVKYMGFAISKVNFDNANVIWCCRENRLTSLRLYIMLLAANAYSSFNPISVLLKEIDHNVLIVAAEEQSVPMFACLYLCVMPLLCLCMGFEVDRFDCQVGFQIKSCLHF